MKEGVGPLWNGTAASLILVSNPALKFTVYEYLKRLASEPLSPSKAFFMGAFASAIATIITYPVQVVQAKSRVIEYALFSKSEKFQCSYPWPFRYVHKELLDVISFIVAFNSGPCRPFEYSVQTLPIV